MSALDVDPLLARPPCDEMFQSIEAKFEAPNIPGESGI